jgi:UDP-glucose 4-epimerase
VTRTFADVTRARTELGYAPQVNIDEGIRRMVAWFRADRAAQLAQTGSASPRPIA